MRIAFFIFFFACALSHRARAQDSVLDNLLPTLSRTEAVYFQKLVEGNNRFAFDLYQKVKNQSGNFYFSPYSIVAGLAMAEVGAKGETAKEFQKVFRYLPQLLLFIGDLSENLQASGDPKDATRVLLANALWLDKSLPVLPSFKLTLQRNFKASLQTADFSSNLSQAIQTINGFVSQQTNGRITGIVSTQDVSLKMRMLLTTAAALSGQWAAPFDPKLTKRLPFQITKQRTLLADMMQNTSNRLLLKGERWDIVSLPFRRIEGKAELFMAALLPKPQVSLEELEKNFTWQNWSDWKSQLKNQWVALSFPRFRIEKRFDLEAQLLGLGFSQAFSPSADFSGMTNEKGVFLNKALHKSSIRIDEKGADAVFFIEKKETASEGQRGTPYDFIADRPFLFVIYDQKTDSIIGMGKVAVP